MSDSVQRLILCVATTLLVSAPLRAQNSSAQTPEVARETYTEGDPFAPARTAIRAQPFEATGYLIAASYFDSIDAIRLATRAYEAAAQLDPSNTRDALRLEADLRAQLQHLEPKEGTLTAAVESMPRNVEPLLDLAVLRLAQDQIKEADKLVRKASAVEDTTTVQEISRLADLVAYSYELDAYLQAVADLDSARVFNADGRYGEAIVLYRKLLRDHPDSTILLSETSAVYANAGDYFSALKYLDEGTTEMTTRERLLSRSALLLRAGLLSEATEELVTYYSRNRDDSAVSEQLEKLYPRLSRFPHARRMVESVRPDLKPEEDAVSPRGIVSSPRQSSFGLSAYPWFQYRDVTSTDYQYNDLAGGLDMAVFVSRRAGILFGASTHAIRFGSTFAGVNDEHTQLSRISVGFDFGGSDLTQQRRQGSYHVTLLVGLSAYSTGQTMPFAETTIEHLSTSGFRSGIEIQSSEGISPDVAPIASHYDSRVSAARVFSQNSFRSLIKYRVSLAILGTSDTGDILSETSTLGSDLEGRIGLRIFPYVHAGGSFRQVDYERFVDVYFAPSLYRRVDGWAEYERRIDNATVRLRSGIGYVVDSNRPVLPFIEGAASGLLAEQVSVAVSGGLSRDARSIRALRFDSADELFTLASMKVSLAWNF